MFMVLNILFVEMYVNAVFVKLFVQRSKFILWLKMALNIYKNDLLSII